MGTLRGRDAVRDAIAGVRDAGSGFTETVADMIIGGDKVVTRYFVTGTHTKPFPGTEPTNQPIHVHEISIYRIQDELIAEQSCGKVVNDLSVATTALMHTPPFYERHSYFSAVRK